MLSIVSLSFSADNQKTKKLEKRSLTQKYIDSLREGKWGITDADWVDINLAKEWNKNKQSIGKGMYRYTSFSNRRRRSRKR